MSKGLDVPPMEIFDKVGLTVGVFDYLHPGHIMMFQECHKQCDYLIVGINDATNLDAWKQKPIQLLKERIMMVEALEGVNETFVYSGEKELYKLLQKHKNNKEVEAMLFERLTLPEIPSFSTRGEISIIWL